jgi:hypothetical protein
LGTAIYNLTQKEKVEKENIRKKYELKIKEIKEKFKKEVENQNEWFDKLKIKYINKVEKDLFS